MSQLDCESGQSELINRRPMPRLGQRQTLDRTSLTPRATDGTEILPTLVHDVIHRVCRCLQMEELGVLTTQSDQLFVAAALDHSSMIENVNAVCRPYRGEAMGDDQGGPTPEHLVQRGKQLILGSGIEGRRGLIDDH